MKIQNIYPVLLSSLLSFGIILIVGCATTLDDFYFGIETTTDQTVPTPQTTTSSNTDKLLSSTNTTNTGSTTLSQSYSYTTSTDVPATFPELTLITPMDGQQLSSTFQISGTASDDVEVFDVYVKLDDGEYVKAQGVTNWNYTFNSVSLTAHTITIRVRDNDNNETTRTVSVEVIDDNTPPTVAFTNPLLGEWIKGEWTLEGIATDNNDISKVELRVDDGSYGLALGTDSWSFDIAGLSDGYHFLSARAWDYHDNMSSEEIYIEVENNPPDLTLLFPSENYHVGGLVAINGTADDFGQSGVDTVEVSIDGGDWELADGTETWQYNWNTSSLALGEYTIEVRCTDNVTNTTDVQLITVKKTEWANLGSHLNEGTESATYPSIATNGATMYVAFQEKVSNIYQVYVKRWNGTTWEIVGSDGVAGELNLDNTQHAENPTISYDTTNNVLDCAWREYDTGSGQYKVYAKRWDGASWTQLGGALNNVAGQNVQYPVLAHRRGTGPIVPYVAWAERHDTWDGASETYQVFCREWSGAAWSSIIGGSAINNEYDHYYRVRYIDLGFDQEKPIVIYAEDTDRDNGTNFDILVKKWNGSNWSYIGSNPLDSSSYSYYPTVDADDSTGVVYATWSEYNGSFYNIKAKKYEGGSWTALGSALSEDTSQHAYYPDIQINSGYPYVTWYESDSIINHVYLKKWDGASWSLLAQDTDYGLNVNPLFSAYHPHLIFNAADVPYVTFIETDGVQARVFMKYYTIP
jgi:hypothetical protein